MYPATIQTVLHKRSIAHIARCTMWVVLIVGYSPTFSQPQTLKFEHLGTREGLSHSNTICMLQDSRGIMWFGTRDGLNKYDGYNITIYRNDPKNKNSISDNLISALVEDP